LHPAGPIRGVPINNRHLAVAVAVAVVGVGVGGEDVVDEVVGDRSITDVARGDDRGGDDLGVRIFGDVALVSVKAPGCGLVAMERSCKTICVSPYGGCATVVGMK
jgi:hypothetical protein